MFEIFKILITAITTLLFTGIIGNKIIIKFQRDNWLYQQKFQNNEKDLKEFEKVIAEINSLISSRISRMRIYIDEQISNDGRIEEETRAGYIKLKDEWNDKLNNFYHFYSLMSLLIYRYILKGKFKSVLFQFIMTCVTQM